MELESKIEFLIASIMKCFIFPVFVVILLQACSGNKDRGATNIQDSLKAQTAFPVVTDSLARQSSNQSASEQAADSSALASAAAMFNLPGDSNSLAHMKDSMLSMAKDKLGKNAGVLDSMMSAMSKVPTSSSDTSGSSNDITTKKSIPYREPLAADYVIPVTGNGNDFYYEYVGGSEVGDKKSGLSFTISIDPSKRSGWNVYLDGYAQMEQFGINSHYSFLMNNSFTHVLLNNDHKVYTTQKSEAVIREKNYTVTDIKVVKIGEEKLHGFNCVHAKVTSLTHFMGQAQSNEFDIWRSEEVPGASNLESSIQVLSSPFTLAIEDQLVKMGCRGAIVKIEFDQKSSVVRKELFKITKEDMDDFIFNVPSDFKEDKNTTLYSLVPGN